MHCVCVGEEGDGEVMQPSGAGLRQKCESQPPTRSGIACVFITAVPITGKAVREGGGGEWRTCATRDYEPRSM
jgi:hypothetical protein